MGVSRRGVLGMAAAVGAGWLAPHRGFAEEGVDFSGAQNEDFVVLKAPDGAPILRYVRENLTEGERRPAVDGSCYTHPLLTPSGAIVSDLAPEDHPHHRGVFCGWVEMEGENRGDWWGWGAHAPKDGRAIVNREARITEADASSVTLRLINSWRAEAETVLGERLTITVRRAARCNVMDFDYKLTVPTRKPLQIAQSLFGGFCYRARPQGKLTVSGPDGALHLPDAVSDKPETNWPASPWYDLSYETEAGITLGACVMDHPSNPVSTWHGVRSLHMLNPCFVATGPHTIEFGEPLFLKYRLVAHDGDAASVDLARLHRQFTGDV